VAVSCIHGSQDPETSTLKSIQKILSDVSANGEEESSRALRRASTAFLEAQVGAARLLGDQRRLLAWVTPLASRLSADEAYAKCSELLEEMSWAAPVLEILSRVYSDSTDPMIRRLADRINTEHT
jgi:hypothetical protein